MADDFALSISRFADMATEEVIQVRKNAQMRLTGLVIKKTPSRTGLARMNWIPTRDAPASYSITLASGGAGGANPQGDAQAVAFGEDGVFYLTNNLSYIGVIEYGGYPNPVKFGTWVKTGSGGYYEKRSSGGYSKQAPQGMARLSLQEVSDELRAKYG